MGSKVRSHRTRELARTPRLTLFLPQGTPPDLVKAIGNAGKNARHVILKKMDKGKLTKEYMDWFIDTYS